MVSGYAVPLPTSLPPTSSTLKGLPYPRSVDWHSRLVAGCAGQCRAAWVQSAALELAGSRAAFAQGDVLLGSKLAGASRANLLCAFDLCCKQAHERPGPTYAELQRQRQAEEDAFVAAHPELFADDDEEVSQ